MVKHGLPIILGHAVGTGHGGFTAGAGPLVDDLIADGQSGATARELFPSAYAAQPDVKLAQGSVTVGKTREQVRSELEDARRNGDLIANGETGATYRDLAPHRYAPAAAVQAKSRADVRAEFEAARRNGDLIADGQSGATARELFPSAYAAQADVKRALGITTAGKTREQVGDELVQARRSGTVPSAN